jgi:hypothetical protein
LSTDEQAADFLKQLAFRAGPVSDALSEVARKLKSGDLKSGEAARTFLGDVRRAVEAGVVTGDDAGGPVDGAGGERPLTPSDDYEASVRALIGDGSPERLAQYADIRSNEIRQRIDAIIRARENIETMEAGARGHLAQNQRDNIRMEETALSELKAELETNLSPDEAARIWRETGAEDFQGGPALFQPAPPIDTPEFNRWFGSSKIVDASGAPLVLYHGSTKDFEAFDPRQATDHKTRGKGVMFFTTKPEVASSYAGVFDVQGEAAPRVSEGGNVTPVYLKAENPAVWDVFGGEFTSEFVTKAIKEAKRDGHDSIVFRNMRDEPTYMGSGTPRASHVIAVFEPTQIKSTFNRGTFDPSDPRILYQNKPALWKEGDMLGEFNTERGLEGLPQAVIPGAEVTDADRLRLAMSKPLTGGNAPPPKGGLFDETGRQDAADQLTLFQPAYHGTPHIFDKFDSSKIGTGEGAQAFGHGLYFAGRKEVAKYYRDTLAGRSSIEPLDYYMDDTVRLGRGAMPSTEDFLRDNNIPVEPETVALVNRIIDGGTSSRGEITYTPDAIRAYGDLEKKLLKPGRLLTVDIPGDDELMNWDMRLKEQPDAIRAKIESLPEYAVLREKWAELASRDFGVTKQEAIDSGNYNPTAAEFYSSLASLKGEQITVDNSMGWGSTGNRGDSAAHEPDFVAASAALRSAGIPGHKFLEGASRSKPQAIAGMKRDLAAWEGRLKDAPDDAYVKGEVEARREELAKAEAGIAHNYVIYDDSKINVTSYEQQKRGMIQLAEGQRPMITLFEKADASTFLHETGHQWLEELIRDAKTEGVSDVVKVDEGTVRNWLGMKPDQAAPTTKQHEKFARGFEQYLREGTAPSAALGRVFAQFKSWLMDIYRSIKGLGAPINEDIRSVFDRMIELEPQRTVIAPEAEAPRGMADLHSNDAEMIPAEEAEPAMDRVIAERDRAIAEMPVEVRNELAAAEAAFTAANAGTETGDGAGGPDQVVDAGGLAEPLPAGAARSGEPGAVDQLGGEAGNEGAGPAPAPAGDAGLRNERPGAADAARANPLAPEPTAYFGKADDPLVDKAGNIRLDNLTDDTDVRNAIRASASANSDFIGDRRGVITMGQQQDLAEALGMTAESLSTRKIGEAFNAEQVWAARKLLVQSAETVVSLAKRAASGSDQDVLAYAQAAERHRMIQAQIAGITAEAGRALAAFRNMKGALSVKTLDQLLRDSTAKTLFQLKQEAALGAILDSPQAVSKFMIERSEKKGVIAGALEWWINALVSGPRTHVTNLVSNTLFGIQRMGPDTIAAAALGEIRQALGQKRQRVQFAEVGAKFGRLGEASATGAVAAIDALKSGKSIELPSEQLQPELPYQPGSESAPAPKLDLDATAADILPRAFGLTRGILDSMIASGKLVQAGGEAGAPLLGLKRSALGVIPDIQYRGATIAPVGTLARLPTRLLAAEDSFFRSVLYRTEIGAQAVRQAMAEGLTGGSRDARIADLYQNPTKDMMELAVREAAAGTFTARRSKFVNFLTQAANQNIGGVPILRFIIPFINTPANILEQTALHRTPLGLVLKGEVQNDLLGRNGDIAQDQAWGRLLVGTAYILGFGALAAQGLLNGSGPTDPSERAAWRMAGNQPNSVRIGDTWFDMRALGPLGLLASMSADSVDIAKTASEGDVTAVASTLMNAVTQNFLNASFMTGPSDFIQAVQNPDRYGEAYIEKLVSSFTVPSLVAQPARAMDPNLRDVRSTWDAILARTPASTSLQPRIDIWGEPMSSGSSLGPGGLSPIYTSKMSKDPVTLYLASSGYWPAPVQRKIRGVELTGDEFVEYATLAGRMTKQRLDMIVTSPQFAQWPPNSRLDIVREVISQSRETARGYMTVRHPRIAIEAVRLKQGAAAENLE